MDRIRVEHRHTDVACALEATDQGLRAAEWERLRHDAALAAERIPNGARLWLRADAAATAEDLVHKETRCCGFLDFELVPDTGRIRLDITSATSAGSEVAAILAGMGPDAPSPPC